MDALRNLWFKFRALNSLVQAAIVIVVLLFLLHYGGAHEGPYIDLPGGAN